MTKKKRTSKRTDDRRLGEAACSAAHVTDTLNFLLEAMVEMRGIIGQHLRVEREQSQKIALKLSMADILIARLRAQQNDGAKTLR